MRSTRLSLLLVLGQVINGALSEKPIDRWPVKRVATERAFDAESSLNPRNVLPMSSLAKRRDCSGCSSGYCCQDDVCVSSSIDNCCGGFYCKSLDVCCNDGCIDIGDDCCSGGGYCKGLYECATVGGKPKCCKFGDCDDGDRDVISQDDKGGSGSGGSGSGSSSTSIGGDTQAYSSTMTITAASMTKTTVISFRATDSKDASISFYSVSNSIVAGLVVSGTDGGGGGSLPTDLDDITNLPTDPAYAPTGGGDDVGGGPVGGVGGGGGPYPYPQEYSGATAGTLWRSGFGYLYTAVYAGMILVPAFLAVYI